jgi:nitroreductase / dihydropteridine reductase
MEERIYEMNYLERFKWRYATKQMNGEKIPKESIDRILEAIQLAPTSLGLQPFEVLVLESEESRKKLKPEGNDQPQVLQCSHLLVFAVYRKIDPSHVEAYINHIATTRGEPVESLAGFKKAIQSSVDGRTVEENQHWASKQAYIAFGFGLAAAALENVDATPMEGFKPDKVDEILGLESKNLKSVVMLALGYRNSEKDPLASKKKVRKQTEKFFHFL